MAFNPMDPVGIIGKMAPKRTPKQDPTDLSRSMVRNVGRSSTATPAPANPSRRKRK